MILTLRRVAQPMFVAGALSSVVVIEPAPVDLLLVALCGIWLVRDGLRLSRTALGVGLAYISMSAISQVIGGLDGVPFNANVVRDLAIETYLVVMCVCILAKFRRSPEALRSFVHGIIFGAVAVSVAFIALLMVNRVPDLLYRDASRVRVAGLFKDPNVLGPFLIFPCMALLFRNEMLNLRIGKLLALPCLVVLGLTYSRGAYVGMIVTTALVVVAIAMTERLTYNGALLGLLLVVSSVIALTVVWSTAGLPAVEVNTTRLSYQSYDNDRFSTLAAAFEYILEHPLGNGVQAFSDSHGTNPHNLFLGKAADAGIAAGLLVVIVPLIAATRAMFLRHDHIARFSLLIGATIAGNMVVSSVIYAHHWRHMFFLVAIAFAVTGKQANDDITIDLRTSAGRHDRAAEPMGVGA